MLTRYQAKSHLKKLGWTYRSVAPVLQVHFTHLAHVMRGTRPAGRILRAIEGLPSFKEWKREH
jgi:hypothetical protein